MNLKGHHIEQLTTGYNIPIQDITFNDNKKELHLVWTKERGTGVCSSLFAPQLHEDKNFASNVGLPGKVVFIFAHMILFSYHLSCF